MTRKVIRALRSIQKCFAGNDFQAMAQLLQNGSLEGFDLRQLDFSKLIAEAKRNPQFKPFVGAKLSGTNLSGQDLSSMDFTGADLEGSKLKRVNFFRSHLDGAKLDGCKAIRANFEKAQMNGVSLVEANLVKAKFNETSMNGGKFKEVNFQGANVYKVTLIGADLSGANFDGASLVGSNLSGANLCGTRLSAVNCHGTDFTDIKLDKKTHVGSNLLQAANMPKVLLDLAEAAAESDKQRLREAIAQKSVHISTPTLAPAPPARESVPPPSVGQGNGRAPDSGKKIE